MRSPYFRTLAGALAVLAITACGGGAAPAASTPVPAKPTEAVTKPGPAPASPAAASPAATSPAASASQPKTLAELALYQGADRESILVEGAKKEGNVVLYTSNSQIEGITKNFMQKYPFLKVDVLRNQNTVLQERLTQEFKANTVHADVVESSADGIGQMIPLGIFQEFVSPDISFFDSGDQTKGPGGNLIALADREIYNGLGWNTKLIDSSTVPQDLDGLLDPKWKGKFGMVSTTTGIEWIGMVYEIKGEDWVKRFAQQNVKIQNITGAAMTDLVVSGEVPMSPHLGFANVLQAQAKGAPVQWLPLDPVLTTIGASGLINKAPHPYAAVLLLDYLHSKDGQTAARDEQQVDSPRSDLARSGVRPFTKLVLSNKYTPAQYAEQAARWEQIFRQYFLAAA